MSFKKKNKSIPRSSQMRNMGGVNHSSYVTTLQQTQTVNVELKKILDGKENDGAYILNGFSKVPSDYNNYPRKFSITYTDNIITKVDPENSLGYLIHDTVKKRREYIKIENTNDPSVLKCNYFSTSYRITSYMLLSIVDS